MKTPSKTEIHLVLDASGSMYSRRADVIGSLNLFMEEQKQIEGKCRVTLVQFNGDVTVTLDNVKLKKVPKFTNSSYLPSGITALYDAIGKTAAAIEARKIEDDTKVIIVIMTDGYENASKEYTYDNIKRILDANPQWEVVFLGADIDSSGVASAIGVAAHKTMDYANNAMGTQCAYQSMSKNIGDVRMGVKVDMTIEPEDFEAQERALGKTSNSS